MIAVTLITAIAAAAASSAPGERSLPICQAWALPAGFQAAGNMFEYLTPPYLADSLHAGMKQEQLDALTPIAWKVIGHVRQSRGLDDEQFAREFSGSALPFLPEYNAEVGQLEYPVAEGSTNRVEQGLYERLRALAIDGARQFVTGPERGKIQFSPGMTVQSLSTRAQTCARPRTSAPETDQLVRRLEFYEDFRALQAGFVTIDGRSQGEVVATLTFTPLWIAKDITVSPTLENSTPIRFDIEMPPALPAEVLRLRLLSVAPDGSEQELRSHTGVLSYGRAQTWLVREPVPAGHKVRMAVELRTDAAELKALRDENFAITVRVQDARLTGVDP